MLSFTTLGCPDWDLATTIDRAAAYGFDAIDFRGLHGEMEVWKLPEFAADGLDNANRIADAGLAVSCFSSSVQVANPDRVEANKDEIEAYARLCETFGTKHIRAFGGRIGETDRAAAVEHTAAHLTELAAIAADHGARILIETHDAWTACEHVAAVLSRVDGAAGVLWDVHHPYRTLGEQPETTLAALGPWIENTHWKDSAGSTDDFAYCAMGEGDIPLPHIAKLLQDAGYEGYHTFEWEKKWHPELAEPEVAFPQYVEYMRAL